MEIMYKPIKYQCEKCKSVIDASDNFCSHCGNDLSAMEIFTESNDDYSKSMYAGAR